VLNYLVVLYLACVESFGLLDVVVLHLLCVEALHFMLSQRAYVAKYSRQGLHKANHGLCALRIKFVIITRLNLTKTCQTRLNCLLEGVLRNLGLNVVSIVCYKTHAIVKFNVEGLVVYTGPLAGDGSLVTSSSSFAEDSLHFVVIEQVHFVNVILRKCKLIIFVHQLYLVGHVVSAKLFCIPQTDYSLFLADMEVPLAE